MISHARIVFFESNGKFGYVAFVPTEDGQRPALEVPAVYASLKDASVAWGDLRFTMTHGVPDIEIDKDLVTLVKRGDVVVEGLQS